jgi:PadR family transcriptional regulator, regulatory protein PadR
MNDQGKDLLKGTLDMLILQALEREPMHGWGIAEQIETSSRDVFRLQTGTVYPALHRLLRKGWIAAAWRTTEHNRQARYYQLTAAGRRQLEAQRASWKRASLAVNRVLDALS